MATCYLCGEPIKQVDLYGTPFFEHASQHERWTWWHVDASRNNHQAKP